MRLTNCIYVRMKNVNDQIKVKAMMQNMPGCSVVLFDGLNGLLQIPEGSKPETFLNKMKNNTLIFSAVSFMKNFVIQ